MLQYGYDEQEAQRQYLLWRIVIPGFESLLVNELPPDINSAILIYNYEYNCDIKEVKRDGYNYVFIGSVQYE